MEYEVIGIKKVDYINKLGKRVVGYSLYLAFVNDSINGVGTKEIFVKHDILSGDIKLKDIITLLYNEYGGVARIEYIK